MFTSADFLRANDDVLIAIFVSIVYYSIVNKPQNNLILGGSTMYKYYRNEFKWALRALFFLMLRFVRDFLCVKLHINIYDGCVEIYMKRTTLRFWKPHGKLQCDRHVKTTEGWKQVA